MVNGISGFENGGAGIMIGHKSELNVAGAAPSFSRILLLSGLISICYMFSKKENICDRSQIFGGK